MPRDSKVMLSDTGIKKLIRKELEKRGITGRINFEWDVDDEDICLTVSKETEFFGEDISFEMQLDQSCLDKIITNSFDPDSIEVKHIDYVCIKKEYDDYDIEEDDDYDDEDDYIFSHVVVTYEQYTCNKCVPRLKKGRK